MHAKVHLLIGRSCCLPRCNSLDDKINEQEYSSYSVMLTFVLCSRMQLCKCKATILCLMKYCKHNNNSMILTVHTNWEYIRY